MLKQADKEPHRGNDIAIAVAAFVLFGAVVLAVALGVIPSPP